MLYRRARLEKRAGARWDERPDRDTRARWSRDATRVG